MAKARPRAVGYLRVSSRGQLQGSGLDRQEEAIRGYCKKSKLNLVEIFQEKGISGTKGIADRPALADLFSRVMGNGVTVVVVERADRLARDLVEAELILREFRRVGITVISAESGTDLSGENDSPQSVLIRQILNAVSEFDKSSLVLKLRASRIKKRRETGRCEGIHPFGSQPGEAETLSRMRKLRRKPRGGQRLSYRKIADQLNAENRPTRYGGKWVLGSIAKILDGR